MPSSHINGQRLILSIGKKDIKELGLDDIPLGVIKQWIINGRNIELMNDLQSEIHLLNEKIDKLSTFLANSQTLIALSNIPLTYKMEVLKRKSKKDIELNNEERVMLQIYKEQLELLENINHLTINIDKINFLSEYESI